MLLLRESIKCGTIFNVMEYTCKRHGLVSPDRVAVRKEGTRYCKDCNNESVRRCLARKAGADIPKRAGGKFAEIGDTRIQEGYVLEKVGQDKSCHHRAHKGGWVRQHILVAEKKYGIKITTDYTVHHKNGNGLDNRPENLELRIGAHGKHGDILPSLLRDEAMRLEAIDILQQYGYVVTA